ncbi:MAG: ArsR/SmtB family transcription factor [Candidatus Njordarchaeales archaeon]
MYESEDELSKFFEALSHPIRVRILKILSMGDKYISELARELNISRPLLYMHLSKLNKVGLVEMYIKHSDEPPYVKRFVRAKKYMLKILLPELDVKLESRG